MKKFLLLLFISTMAIAATILTWERPVERVDNMPLSIEEIGGYKVYCGASKGNYTSVYLIEDGTATSVDFTTLNMPNGTSYCVVTTIDTDGRESEYSNEATIITEYIKNNPKPPIVPEGTSINVLIQYK